MFSYIKITFLLSRYWHTTEAPLDCIGDS